MSSDTIRMRARETAGAAAPSTLQRAGKQRACVHSRELWDAVSGAEGQHICMQGLAAARLPAQQGRELPSLAAPPDKQHMAPSAG